MQILYCSVLRPLNLTPNISYSKHLRQSSTFVRPDYSDSSILRVIFLVGLALRFVPPTSFPSPTSNAFVEIVRCIVCPLPRHRTSFLNEMIRMLLGSRVRVFANSLPKFHQESIAPWRRARRTTVLGCVAALSADKSISWLANVYVDRWHAALRTADASTTRRLHAAPVFVVARMVGSRLTPVDTTGVSAASVLVITRVVGMLLAGFTWVANVLWSGRASSARATRVARVAAAAAWV